MIFIQNERMKGPNHGMASDNCVSLWQYNGTRSSKEVDLSKIVIESMCGRRSIVWLPIVGFVPCGISIGSLYICSKKIIPHEFLNYTMTQKKKKSRKLLPSSSIHTTFGSSQSSRVKATVVRLHDMNCKCSHSITSKVPFTPF